MTTLQEQARALGDPTRHAIFLRIAEADRPLGVSELTAHVGRNHNAVRQHLARLVAADLIDEATAPTAGRGRPRLEYRINPAAEGQWGTSGPYEELSRLLAEVIATGDTPRAVGRRGAARVRMSSPSSDPVADMAAVMARQGFEPEVRRVRGGIEVVLTACPYATTALDARDTVCSLHLGLAEGLAEGTEVVVDELVAQDPRQAGCRLRLRFEAVGDEEDPMMGTLTIRGGDRARSTRD